MSTMSQAPKSWVAVARKSGTEAYVPGCDSSWPTRSWTLPWKMNRQVEPARYCSANSRAQPGYHFGTATAPSPGKGTGAADEPVGRTAGAVGWAAGSGSTLPFTTG